MRPLGTSQIMSVFCVLTGMGVVIAQTNQVDVRAPGGGAGTPAADAALPSARPSNPFRTVPQGAVPTSIVKTIQQGDKKAAKPETPVVVAAPPSQTDGAGTTDPRQALELRRLRAIQEKAQEEGKRVFSRVNPLLRSNPGAFDAPQPAKSKRPAGTREGASKSADKLSRISSEEPETSDPLLKTVPVASPGGVKLTTGSVPPQKSAAITPSDTTADTPQPPKPVAKPQRARSKVRSARTRRARSWRRRREDRPKYRYDPAMGRPKAWDLP